MKINRTVIFTILAWMILIAMSFLWNYTNAIQERERTALNAAKGFFDHIVITRLWNARHGGVYVPVTEEMQPNSYLDIPMRDIEVNDKLKLTKVNPAYMTRQISEIAKEQDGVEFHMTSLMPIRPQNKPTVREEEFLREFDKGVKEKGVFIKDGSNDYFFYMAPLLTSKSCLECHAEQGYKEGDVRGGISVTFPFDPNILIFPLLSGHIVIGFIGILGIVIAGGRLNKAYETIKIQAIFDSLTGVPNRRSFSRKILEEYKRSKRYHESMSIIMCDIDNFKTYNDTYGHSRGDECLRKVAQQIQSSLHRPGDFCARYGGEEFIVILPNTFLDGAMYVAERIRSSVEQMGISHDSSLPTKVVTLSLGVATLEKDSLLSHEELIRHADTALFKGKEQGKNQVRSFSEDA